jgi:HEPN domain
LTLEKILKAFWVKDNIANIPPKLHNLNYLLQQTNLDVTDEAEEFFTIFNQFQLEGRYPDYHFIIHQRLDEIETTKWIEQFKHYHEFLLSKIVSEL